MYQMSSTNFPAALFGASRLMYPLTDGGDLIHLGNQRSAGWDVFGAGYLLLLDTLPVLVTG